MPSPFPGMNPYLEQDDVSRDFHKSFLARMAQMIAAELAAHYYVKITEQIYLREPSSDQPVLVNHKAAPRVERQTPPFLVTLPTVDIERSSFLEIRDKRNRSVVTVIELLSPANKYSGVDRVQYLAKRGYYLASRIHFVEIDLLRGGPRMPFETPLPKCDYCVMVSRVENRPDAELWPISLREPLPKIPIPVRESDADAVIDLQAALNHVYDGVLYGNYIYEGTPEPNLSSDDALWATAFVPKSA
jgi:hypothetical protein